MISDGMPIVYYYEYLDSLVADARYLLQVQLPIYDLVVTEKKHSLKSLPVTRETSA